LKEVAISKGAVGMYVSLDLNSYGIRFNDREKKIIAALREEDMMLSCTAEGFKEAGIDAIDPRTLKWRCDFAPFDESVDDPFISEEEYMERERLYGERFGFYEDDGEDWEMNDCPGYKGFLQYKSEPKFDLNKKKEWALEWSLMYVWIQGGSDLVREDESSLFGLSPCEWGSIRRHKKKPFKRKRKKKGKHPWKCKCSLTVYTRSPGTWLFSDNPKLKLLRFYGSKRKRRKDRRFLFECDLITGPAISLFGSDDRSAVEKGFYSSQCERETIGEVLVNCRMFQTQDLLLLYDLNKRCKEVKFIMTGSLCGPNWLGVVVLTSEKEVVFLLWIRSRRRKSGFVFLTGSQ
jgi:hypothetical protein